ncbi:MAG: transketolase [Bradymonadales bacterium]|nr:transketolase [Bradymonadales bacterium]
MGEQFTPIDRLCINTLRTLAMDTIQNANSGHPGLPLGAAPMAYVLWQRYLRHNPADPDWPDRDRFVLSAGHGSSLLYGLLHLTGYPLSMEDLKSFRQWESLTPGHPEAPLTAGVEATTGPLGQGAANAAGMAIAERMLAHRFNRSGFNLVDHFTYALVSDGDLMEGVSAEAASLAGHLKLGKLVYLYDANDVSLDGPTSLTFSTEEVGKRFEAYGWHVQTVTNGDEDLAGIDRAIEAARLETDRPSFILIKTTIGYGSPNKAGKAAVHGSPLGAKEIALTKEALGWPSQEPFHIPGEALAHFRQALERGRRSQSDWEAMFSAYELEHPDLARAWRETWTGQLPEGWDGDLPTYPAGGAVATRSAGGDALNALARRLPWLVTGAADLSSSTQTNFKGEPVLDGRSGAGRVIYYGVREHAMGAIANGMAYHGGIRPVASTFFVFSDYMRPAVRLAALNHLPVIYVWTHDSVGVGEDGPTHQPVEQLMSLRCMANMTLIRPCDAAETIEAWRVAIAHTQGPVGLVLTRQKLAVLDRSRYASAAGLARGAYILADAAGGAPQAILIGTGSEVEVVRKAQELLEQQGIPVRLVSMPCWELFEAQGQPYQDEVLPPSIKVRVAVEAGSTFGWRRWVGDHGVAVGIDRYGASAPGEVIMEKLGLTPENVARLVRDLLARQG